MNVKCPAYPGFNGFAYATINSDEACVDETALANNFKLNIRVTKQANAIATPQLEGLKSLS